MESINRLKNPEIDLENGKRLAFSPESTPEEKREGLLLLDSASRKGNPEAQYIIGKMLLEGTISLKIGDSTSAAIDLLYKAARKEYYPARILISNYCRKRYNRAFPAGEKKKQPLTDFDGNRIVINHTGKMVPVDAVLNYTDQGENILTFSLNLMILDENVKVEDPAKLKAAIINGIRMWEGNYTVFGGQQLRAKINITEEPRLFDNVVIALMGGDFLRLLKKSTSIRRSDKALRLRSVINDKRSMAAMGYKKWSVRTRRIICLHSQTDTFNDYNEIMHVVKHEFGHVLGLGDLYEESGAGLPGVPAGSYPELDCFVVKDQFYHLVMCDHHGLISNNDIEMVVLAFSENRLQQYQPTEKNKKISKALGRGN